MPGKPVLADYTLRIIPARSEQEAHFLAALLNSAPCVATLYFSSTGVQTQRYHAGDAEKVAIRPFTGTKQEIELAELSKSCHSAARDGDAIAVQKTEDRIDHKAATYWRISSTELIEIKKSLLPYAVQSSARDGANSENEEA
jgi:hypothetical protein